MIRVSDIAMYLKCPRMCYFMIKGHEPSKGSGYLERMLLKELALRYELAFKSEDKLSFLKNELDCISNEIRAVYRTELSGIDDAVLAKSVSDVRSYLETICSNLSSHADFYNCKQAQIEPVLRSEKFGLTGSPDKLIKMNDATIPSIIKTGNMPENGVWHSDRIQLTAYAILVEEKYNLVVERGFVEYARWGNVREVKIKRHERRKVLQVRDKIKKIQSGVMPEKLEDAPCEYCGFKEMCDIKPTLASRFF